MGTGNLKQLVDQTPPRFRVSDSRLRISAALLSLAAGLVLALQVAPAFNHGYWYGITTIVLAGSQVAYGMLLLVEGWKTDHLGRRRSSVAATKGACRWYRGGFLVKLGFVLVFMLAPLGITAPLGSIELQTLNVAIEVPVLMLLGILIHRTAIVRGTEGNSPSRKEDR